MGQPTLVRLYTMRCQTEGQMVEQRGLAGARVPEQDQMAMLGNRLQRHQRTVLVLSPQTTFPPPWCIPVSTGHCRGGVQVYIDAGEIEGLLYPSGITGADVYSPQREMTVGGDQHMAVG